MCILCAFEPFVIRSLTLGIKAKFSSEMRKFRVSWGNDSALNNKQVTSIFSQEIVCQEKTTL